MTTTDVLETIFVMKGAQQMQGALTGLAGGFTAFAEAEGVAAASTAVLGGVIETLLDPLNLVIIAVTAFVGIFTGSISAFSASEEAIGRIATSLKDMGNVFPAEELVAFSNHLQDLTGISHNTIEKLGGLASTFGLTRAQIEKAIPVALDIGVTRGIDPSLVIKKLFSASGNRIQGLRALGINPASIKGDLHDINNLINQIGKGFAGTAEAFRHTLPGTTIAFNASLTRLGENLGRFFSPVWIFLLNTFIAAMDQASAVLKAIADLLHLPTAAELGKGAPNPLALKGDPEQTEALQGIERHTAALDPFIKHVLGGKGDVARRSYTWRDQKLAIGI